MHNSGYTELAKSSRIDSILRFGTTKNTISNEFPVYQTKNSLNNHQRLIYDKTKSKSKLIENRFDLDDEEDENDENDEDIDNQTSALKRLVCHLCCF
jgi:hypothetical protein